MKTLILASFLILTVHADEIKFGFKSPTFDGNGYSAHMINLENLRYTREKSIRDELKSMEMQAQLLKDRQPINSFLTSLQTRIYSELSKQVTEQLFTANGAEAGSFTLDGNTVIWGKIGDVITLTVYDVDGKTTTIRIPVGNLALPPVNNTNGTPP